MLQWILHLALWPPKYFLMIPNVSPSTKVNKESYTFTTPFLHSMFDIKIQWCLVLLNMTCMKFFGRVFFDWFWSKVEQRPPMVVNCLFIRNCAYWICLSVSSKPVSTISLLVIFRLRLSHLTHMSSSISAPVLQLAVTERSTVLLWLKDGHSAISLASSFTTGQPFCSSLEEALHHLDWNKADSFFYPTFFTNEAKKCMEPPSHFAPYPCTYNICGFQLLCI